MSKNPKILKAKLQQISEKDMPVAWTQWEQTTGSLDSLTFYLHKNCCVLHCTGIDFNLVTYTYQNLYHICERLKWHLQGIYAI